MVDLIAPHPHPLQHNNDIVFKRYVTSCLSYCYLFLYFITHDGHLRAVNLRSKKITCVRTPNSKSEKPVSFATGSG